MRGFYPKHQADIEHILKKAPLSNDVFLSIMDEMHTAYSLAEVTERELKRNREQYSIHYKRKASEYEAKSKAFDEVIDLYVNGSNKYLQTKRHTLDVFIEDVAEILKPFTDEYESGEPNE